jgi:DNA recombination-dependent growth factor C
MKEATELGELLKLPNLEDETTALINAKMREFIGEVKPTPPEIKQEAESILAEWLGAQKEGE